MNIILYNNDMIIEYLYYIRNMTYYSPVKHEMFTILAGI